jgi:hypothetical protein
MQARRQAFMKELVGRLNAYRQSQPALGKVVHEGRCRQEITAGNINVRIETDPSGGSVFLIPTFFYDLCRAQNIDPDDTRRCNRWREAISGRTASVSGDYLYIVRWPDGASRRGKLSVVERDWDGGVILRKQ